MLVCRMIRSPSEGFRLFTEKETQPHQTHPDSSSHTRPIQTQPNQNHPDSSSQTRTIQTQPNQTHPDSSSQTRPIQTQPNQTHPDSSSQTRPIQTQPHQTHPDSSSQTRPIQTQPNQTHPDSSSQTRPIQTQPNQNHPDSSSQTRPIQTVAAEPDPSRHPPCCCLPNSIQPSNPVNRWHKSPKSTTTQPLHYSFSLAFQCATIGCVCVSLSPRESERRRVGTPMGEESAQSTLPLATR
uniref:Uncharacterized protein n=1 Tax=Oncorhynchus tshawytscha TaxID=74940 RepID=A0AAZ3PW48_ONCTS